MNKVVWFDFENAPHVWILKEIINSFQKEGIETLITARDFSVTLGLSEHLGIKLDKVSRCKNYKAKFGKLYGVLSRGIELVNYLSKQEIKPVLAVSHGSRSQAFAAFLLKIPVISLDDYEYSAKSFNFFVDKLLTPFPIPKEEWGKFHKKVIHYPGLKEELYLWNESNYLDSNSNQGFADKINVVFRPEGRFTHYSSIKSREMQDSLMKYFSKVKGLHIILLARDKIQETEIEKIFLKEKIEYSIPRNILNGPQLMFHADLVIGGGGTMTREAGILGTPSYSFFGGKLGHVDKYLMEQNKLVLLESENDLMKIQFDKKRNQNPIIKKHAFDYVVNYLKQWLN